ncbi:MAG: PQQ-dependent sugar dehydrogenase [Bythopirellula sp.]
MTKQSLVSLATILALFANGAILQAEVDQRPLSVKIQPAFPNLQWPDWLTGKADGLARQMLPLVVTGAGDGSNRMFVASQYGTIFFFDNSPEATKVHTFLDMRQRVAYDTNQNEEGFLGLAFHPNFAENGQFFVYYTPTHADGSERRVVISRFRVSPDDPNRADPESEEILLSMPQPFWNHNGGTLVFGPDGYLYIGTGDGGKHHDPLMHGQNLQTLLGAILRIDVDRTENPEKGTKLPYGIPPDNPFANVEKQLARREIWAYGIRNIWRMSFDPQTGIFWAADVGQNTWEEINIIEKGGNYGWNLREAKHPVGPGGTGPREDFIEPIWEYGREYGKSITGGHVYRGKQIPELQGAYLYADYVSGHLWALWYEEAQGVVKANRTLRPSGAPVMTFGEDDQGEIYFTSPDGAIMKFASP